MEAIVKPEIELSGDYLILKKSTYQNMLTTINDLRKNTVQSTDYWNMNELKSHLFKGHSINTAKAFINQFRDELDVKNGGFIDYATPVSGRSWFINAAKITAFFNSKIETGQYKLKGSD